jgi:hypothetical protein
LFGAVVPGMGGWLLREAWPKYVGMGTRKRLIVHPADVQDRDGAAIVLRQFLGPLLETRRGTGDGPQLGTTASC